VFGSWRGGVGVVAGLLPAIRSPNPCASGGGGGGDGRPRGVPVCPLTFLCATCFVLIHICGFHKS
jgi:hypothetical protein